MRMLTPKLVSQVSIPSRRRRRRFAPNALPIAIFTDSQSAIRAVSEYEFSSSIALECRDYLQKLSETNQVSLIPGHSNIYGNDRADELARLASSSRFIGPEPAMTVPPSTLNRFLTNLKTQEFSNHWNSLTFARQARNSIRVNRRNSKYCLSLSRNNLRKLVGILTGHNPLKKHLHTIGASNDPHCDLCGDIESTEHFLCHCPAYIKSRCLYLGSYTINFNTIK